MKFMKRIIIAALLISVPGLHFTDVTFAAGHKMFAKTDAGITKHAPEMLAPPETDIPVEAVSTSKTSGKAVAAEKKSNKWLYLGGALLVGGIAAAGGGGGGGSSSTGDITVSW